MIATNTSHTRYWRRSPAITHLLDANTMSQSPEIKVEVECVDLTTQLHKDHTVQLPDSTEAKIPELSLSTGVKRPATPSLDRMERNRPSKKKPHANLTQTSPAPSLSVAEECITVKTKFPLSVAEQCREPSPNTDAAENRASIDAAPTDNRGHARNHSIPNASGNTPATAAEFVNSKGQVPSTRQTPVRQPSILSNAEIVKVRTAHLLIADVLDQMVAAVPGKDIDIVKLGAAYQLIGDVVDRGEAGQSRIHVDMTALKEAHIRLGSIAKSQNDVNIIRLRSVRRITGDILNRGIGEKSRKDTGTSTEECGHGPNSLVGQNLMGIMHEVFIKDSLAQDKGL